MTVGEVLDAMLADLEPGWRRTINKRADMAPAASDAASWLNGKGHAADISVSVADISNEKRMAFRVLLIRDAANQASKEILL